MCPSKAPSPDGLPAAFFQKYWQAVPGGLIDTCLHILNEQGDLTPLNHTYIALIPKICEHRKVTKFRPISLYNLVYRIMAKTIANKMKPVMSQIIFPVQSTFIPNKFVTDIVIIGYDCLYKIGHNKWKKTGWVALKLDISKAYDRVEWVFSKQTMIKLSFSNTWVNLIIRCIRTAFCSVIINGFQEAYFNQREA